MEQAHGLKGTWAQAFRAFFGPIIIILTLRWIFFEPFVIPSGSMIPNLLIHDHILVKKFAYGIKVPFVDKWIVRWGQPQRGEIVVFKFPENPEVYYIKRLIGVPGDVIKVKDGRISVNDLPWDLKLVPADSMGNDLEENSSFHYFQESTPNHPHIVRFIEGDLRSGKEVTYRLGPHQYFFMGDNRDQSSDGRVWGFVDEKLLVGQAWAIWLSCRETLSSAPFVCDPTKLRWSRFFKTVN